MGVGGEPWNGVAQQRVWEVSPANTLRSNLLAASALESRRAAIQGYWAARFQGAGARLVTGRRTFGARGAEVLLGVVLGRERLDTREAAHARSWARVRLGASGRVLVVRVLVSELRSTG